MLYDICARHGIPHKKTGKLLVPRSREEVKLLPRILATALGSGGEGVRLVNKEEIRDLEPNVEADAAIYCPTTGIVDSHALLQHYEAEALQHGVDIARNAEIVGIEKFKGACVRAPVVVVVVVESSDGAIVISHIHRFNQPHTHRQASPHTR